MSQDPEGKEQSDAVRAPNEMSERVRCLPAGAEGLSAMLTEQSASGVSKTSLSSFHIFKKQRKRATQKSLTVSYMSVLDVTIKINLLKK